MPEVKPQSPVDRMRGSWYNAYSRINGEEILLPDDIMEGKGDFVSTDTFGDPEGFFIESVETPDGRNVYVGFGPNDTTRQNSGRLPYDRPSFVLNQQVIQGHPPPSAIFAANTALVPQPPKPVLKTVPADNAGYPASAVGTPYWIAFSYVTEDGKHSLLSPAVPFQVAQGQSIRAVLNRELPEDIYHVGIWLSEPGASTATSTGIMRLQRVLDLRLYAAEYYDLTGPYRYDRQAPTQDETTLSDPGTPFLQTIRTGRPSRAGTYRAAVTFTNDRGETIGSPTITAPATIALSNRFTDDQGDSDAGEYSVRVNRPHAPPGATGWQPYLLLNGQWNRIWNITNDRGRTKSYPIDQLYVETTGWAAGDSNYGEKETHFLINQDIPSVNTTGIAPPDSAPEEPVGFGASIPGPGRFYVRVTDEVRGLESVPSEPSYIDVASGEMLRVVFDTPTNILPNGNFVETTADGLPLDHEVVPSGGFAYVDPEGLFMATAAPIEGAGPYTQTDFLDVYPEDQAVIGGRYTVLEPPSGTRQGAVEAVLVEENASGTLTETVVDYSEELGEHRWDEIVYPSGTPLVLAWQPDTVRARVLHRTVGTSPVNTALRVTLVAITFFPQIVDNYAIIRHRNQNTQQDTYHLVPWWWLTTPPPGQGGSTPPGGPGTPGGVGPPPGRPPVHPPRRPPEPPGPPGPPWQPGDHSPPVIPNPPPTEPPPPPADTVIMPPPSPPEEPEPEPLSVRPLSPPYRPLAAGTLKESLPFDSLPGGWTQTASGGGALSTASSKLVSKKASAGAVGQATLSKTFSPEPGFTQRHDLGIHLKDASIPVLAVNGSVKLAALASGSVDIAWLEFGSEAEQAQLTIYDEPTDPGNVSINLEGTVTTVPVVATKEVVSLDIQSAPGAGGTVAVGLDGLPRYTPVGGPTRETSVLSVAPGPNARGGPSTSGNTTVFLNDVAHNVWIYDSDSRATVANRIRYATYPGWTARWGDNQYQVVFVANDSGAKVDSAFSSGTTGMVGASMTTLVQGGVETAAQLAARIRERSYPGWTVSGSGTNVTFTANVAGQRTPNATFDPGTTGVIYQISTTVEGATDTTSALAARIRAASYPAGWTVGGSGDVVAFNATTYGPRQNSQFDAGGTGVVGQMLTLRQGTNGDLVLYAQDQNGVVNRRRLIGGLTPVETWGAELVVSGSGTDEAIVTAWASLGEAQLQHAARFEHLEFTDLPVTSVQMGGKDSNSALTWELNVGEARITDRGTNYYCDHNAKGELIKQLRNHGRPTQPVRQDIMIQGRRDTVTPTKPYTYAAKVRWAGVPEDVPAEPLFLTAHAPDGRVVELGCVTGGISGDGTGGDSPAWEITKTIETPAGFPEVRINSRNIGAGVIVIQELVASEGYTPKRTYRYATTGFYRATLENFTPKKPRFVNWSYGRSSLTTDVFVPAGCTSVAEYRSGWDRTGPWSIWQTDPSLVEDRPYLQVHFTWTGTGLDTPVLRGFNPSSEYEVREGLRPTSVFLRADRTELEGGANLIDLEEWSRRPEIGVRILPGGRVYRQRTYEPVGHLPASVVQVFSLAARRYVEERWGEELFAIESDGEVLWVKLSAQPEFKRSSVSIHSPDGKQALYVAQLAPCEVVRSKVLA